MSQRIGHELYYHTNYLCYADISEADLPNKNQIQIEIKRM